VSPPDSSTGPAVASALTIQESSRRLDRTSSLEDESSGRARSPAPFEACAVSGYDAVQVAQ
jgi:hypothetical protein